MQAQLNAQSKSCHNDIILKHLKQYGEITAWQAFARYQITRLAARIYDLRNFGYSIETLKEANSHKGVHALYKLRREEP